MRLSYRTVLFIAIFLLPLAAYSFYEIRLATDRFHSDATVSITQGGNAAPSLDLSVLGLPSVSDDKDATTLVTFINSIDMLLALEPELQVREHYSNPSIDWWSRLPPEASLEAFHDYLSKYIVINYDPATHLVNIHVEAFSREYAQKLVNALLAHAQDFVDHLNSRVTVEQTKFFENQLSVTESRLRDAKNELLTFQRENGLLTTDVEAQLINTSIGQLNGMLLKAQGELDVQRRQLNDNSPVIQNLKAQIDTLKKQISEEKDKLSVGTLSSPVSELAARQEEIKFNLEFISTLYKSNLTQLERSRIEAAQRLKYLVVVTNPSIADASLYPNRPYNIITAMIILLMIYFIVTLIIAIIREHA